MIDMTLGDHGGADPRIFCVKSKVVIKILGFGVRVPVSKYQLNNCRLLKLYASISSSVK